MFNLNWVVPKCKRERCPELSPDVPRFEETRESHTKGFIHLFAWDGRREWTTGELACSNQGNCKHRLNKLAKDEAERLLLPHVCVNLDVSSMYLNQKVLTRGAMDLIFLSLSRAWWSLNQGVYTYRIVSPWGSAWFSSLCFSCPATPASSPWRRSTGWRASSIRGRWISWSTFSRRTSSQRSCQT